MAGKSLIMVITRNTIIMNIGDTSLIPAVIPTKLGKLMHAIGAASMPAHAALQGCSTGIDSVSVILGFVSDDS